MNKKNILSYFYSKRRVNFPQIDARGGVFAATEFLGNAGSNDPDNKKKTGRTPRKIGRQGSISGLNSGEIPLKTAV